MENRDKENQENKDNKAKWKNISEKSDEAHRKSLEATDREGDRKWQEGHEDSAEEGKKDWQNLDTDEKAKKEERRGGYPKNVYKKGEE